MNQSENVKFNKVIDDLQASISRVVALIEEQEERNIKITEYINRLIQVMQNSELKFLWMASGVKRKES